MLPLPVVHIHTGTNQGKLSGILRGELNAPAQKSRTNESVQQVSAAPATSSVIAQIFRSLVGAAVRVPHRPSNGHLATNIHTVCNAQV